MVEVGNIVYYRKAEDSSGELVPGLVVDFSAPQMTIEFQEVLTLISGDAGGICFKRNDKLFCAAAAVQMVLESRPRTVIRFRVSGEPETIEGRQSLRVSTAVEKIPVDAGKQAIGQLMDVSGDGLAATLFHEHKLGEVLNLNITFRGQRFTGKATVCNIRDLGGGRFRYGLRPVAREANLTRGLQTIAATLQRERRQREVEHAGR